MHCFAGRCLKTNLNSFGNFHMCTFSLSVNVNCRDWALVAVDFLHVCFVLAEWGRVFYVWSVTEPSLMPLYRRRINLKVKEIHLKASLHHSCIIWKEKSGQNTVRNIFMYKTYRYILCCHVCLLGFVTGVWVFDFLIFRRLKNPGKTSGSLTCHGGP